MALITIKREELENGWTNIYNGDPEMEKLESWIKEYFNIDEDLSGFRRRDGNSGHCNALELVNESHRKGYSFTFVKITVPHIDYESKMQEIRKGFSGSTKRITRYFVDFEKELAGFSWREA